MVRVSVTRCHHSYKELAGFAFFVFVRHTTHCFLLLVCYMFCGWKHCPEEVHLKRWAKCWLIIKCNHQKSLFISLFDLKPGGKRYETTWVEKRTACLTASVRDFTLCGILLEGLVSCNSESITAAHVRDLQPLFVPCRNVTGFAATLVVMYSETENV